MYEIFEELLQKHGVTTYQVSKATGISQSTFSNWKSRRNLLSPDKARMIADYFGVSLDYLMTGKEKEEEKQPELSNIYFSLAREAEQNGIDPRDIKAAIEIFKKMRGEE